MNRRGFLGGLAGILAAGTMPAIVRSESLMILPPRRTIILPSNQLLTMQIITREALKILEYQLLHAEAVNRRCDDNNDNWLTYGKSINLDIRVKSERTGGR